MTIVNGLQREDTSGALLVSGTGAGGAIATTGGGAQTPLTSATVSRVASSITVVTLLAANAARRSGAFYNDSTSALYLKHGATATATDFTVKLAAGQFYELPDPLYTGIVTGIWVAADGGCQVTAGA